ASSSDAPHPAQPRITADGPEQPQRATELGPVHGVRAGAVPVAVRVQAARHGELRPDPEPGIRTGAEHHAVVDPELVEPLERERSERHVAGLAQLAAGADVAFAPRRAEPDVRPVAGLEQPVRRGPPGPGGHDAPAVVTERGERSEETRLNSSHVKISYAV